MAKITTREITDKEIWENFLKVRPEANFLQSWNWGDFHQKLGHTTIRTGFYQGETLTGVMLSVIEHARRATYLTVPGGPIIDWNNKAFLESFKNEIEGIARANNCSFVRVRPQLESNNFSKSTFKTLGFRRSPMHLHAELTSQLDITKSEEELLANMRKATRYEIRRAEKLGIRITRSKDEKYIRKFYNLELKTAKRQGFVPFSYTFLNEQFKIFARSENAVLYSAYFGKKILAQAFIIFYGSEAVYHYGVSTEDGRRYPGAYFIQWNAILEAKRRGIRTYNFWGVANNANHRFANLSIFKRGFGGADFEYLHAQDLIISRPKYLLNYVIEQTRRRIRNV